MAERFELEGDSLEPRLRKDIGDLLRELIVIMCCFSFRLFFTFARISGTLTFREMPRLSRGGGPVSMLLSGSMYISSRR